MATQRQIEANRRNAQKSTGPRTEAGKARSSRNALRHGLTAETVVLDEEEPTAYEAIRESLVEAYAPVGAAELMLVDQVAASYWRTIRSRRIEKAILDQRPADILATFSARFQTYFRYDSAISRDYYRALAALQRVQEHRIREQRRSGNKTHSEMKPTAQTPPNHPPAELAAAPNGFVSQRSPKLSVIYPRTPSPAPASPFSTPQPYLPEGRNNAAGD